MKNKKHFEDLWNDCEALHGSKSDGLGLDAILDEVILKINLYKSFNAIDIPIEEKKKLKSRTLGEILFSLSLLSHQENINVYKALYTALVDHKIEQE